MTYTAALKIKPSELLTMTTKKDGILWEVIAVILPNMVVQESLTTARPLTVSFFTLFKPTKAQMNAYNKRKEKYYATH